jgi:hypothetical protein
LIDVLIGSFFGRTNYEQSNAAGQTDCKRTMNLSRNAVGPDWQMPENKAGNPAWQYDAVGWKTYGEGCTQAVLKELQ